MKRSLLVSLLLLPFLLPLAGCPSATVTPPTTALAPGYINLADQQMGQVLSGARTFYSTVQCETKGLNWSQATSQCVADPSITAPIVLSAAEKAAFNNFMTTLNTAETAHLEFHLGAMTQAAAQALVDQVQKQQSALPALAGK